MRDNNFIIIITLRISELVAYLLIHIGNVILKLILVFYSTTGAYIGGISKLRIVNKTKHFGTLESWVWFGNGILFQNFGKRDVLAIFFSKI